MKIHGRRFRIEKHEKVRLARRPTRVDPFYSSEKKYAKLLASHVAQLSDLQELLYASNRFALLIVFQGMDAAGKDGAIRHVMSGINPQGVQVWSFKHPSDTELQHDFLWRESACLPERGRIGIFNRSYYEEVLVVRVHPELLRGEGFPPAAEEKPELWRERFRSIVDFEQHLHHNHIRIVKFYLHLSKEEQRRRFLSRIDDPAKNWKLTPYDLAERSRWSRYMKCYEECLGATSRRHAPWYVVPADDKLNARLIVSQVLIDTMQDLKLPPPAVDAAHRRALARFRRQLR